MNWSDSCRFAVGSLALLLSISCPASAGGMPKQVLAVGFERNHGRAGVGRLFVRMEVPLSAQWDRVMMCA